MSTRYLPSSQRSDGLCLSESRFSLRRTKCSDGGVCTIAATQIERRRRRKRNEHVWRRQLGAGGHAPEEASGPPSGRRPQSGPRFLASSPPLQWPPRLPCLPPPSRPRLFSCAHSTSHFSFSSLGSSCKFRSNSCHGFNM